MFSTFRTCQIAAVCFTLALPSGVLAQAPRAAKVKKAGKIVPPSAAEVANLSNQDLEVAARTAETLGTNPSPDAHGALLDGLAMGLPPEVAVPAIRGLTNNPIPEDIFTLARYANHANPNVRSAAIAALASYSSPDAHQVIVDRLGDHVAKVRAAAADAAVKGKVRTAVDRMLVLLQRGEEGPARSLAAMADPDLARRIAELLGKMPEPVLAMCLGEILRRPDFGPDTARVEVVRAIGKIQDVSAVAALQDYLDSSPKNEKRTSQIEAKGIVDARGGR